MLLFHRHSSFGDALTEMLNTRLCGGVFYILAFFEKTIDKPNIMYYNVLQKGGHKMTFSLRLNDSDSDLIKKYAALNKMSVSELIRQSVIERIEDEYDLELFHKAMAEYKKNPITYSLDEMEKELGL